MLRREFCKFVCKHTLTGGVLDVDSMVVNNKKAGPVDPSEELLLYINNLWFSKTRFLQPHVIIKMFEVVALVDLCGVFPQDGPGGGDV